jgi:hypothetical protein
MYTFGSVIIKIGLSDLLKDTWTYDLNVTFGAVSNRQFTCTTQKQTERADHIAVITAEQEKNITIIINKHELYTNTNSM